VGINGRQRIAWICRCECNREKLITAANLQRGTTQSCGCLHKENPSKQRAKDITGQRFGRLVALYRMEKRCRGSIVWRLRCDCGREIESGSAPLGTQTKSCGCLRDENRYRHGDTRSTLYHCWQNIKTRCLNPQYEGYKNYGGRGIRMTPEWAEDFVAFQTYINQNLGPRPKGCSIDRIDNDDGYRPGNIRWATKSEQSHNQRRSRLYNGINKLILECLAELRSKPRKRHAVERF
jgi:hypothetical protein